MKVTARMAQSILRYKGPTNVTEDSLAAEVLDLRRRLARSLKALRYESMYDPQWPGRRLGYCDAIDQERAELKAKRSASKKRKEQPR